MTKLDAINERILQELSRDGRLSNLALADRIGLSPSACLRRVQDLERSGVITGYRATLDRAKLGTGFTAYIAVALNNHTKPSQDAFEAAMARAPEVRECHNITGVGRIPASGRGGGPARLQGVPRRNPGHPATGHRAYHLCRDGLAEGRTRLTHRAPR